MVRKEWYQCPYCGCVQTPRLKLITNRLCDSRDCAFGVGTSVTVQVIIANTSFPYRVASCELRPKPLVSTRLGLPIPEKPVCSEHGYKKFNNEHEATCKMCNKSWRIISRHQISRR